MTVRHLPGATNPSNVADPPVESVYPRRAEPWVAHTLPWLGAAGQRPVGCEVMKIISTKDMRDPFYARAAALGDIYAIFDLNSGLRDKVKSCLLYTSPSPR